MDNARKVRLAAKTKMEEEASSEKKLAKTKTEEEVFSEKSEGTLGVVVDKEVV
jgi:hypothetical protein